MRDISIILISSIVFLLSCTASLKTTQHNEREKEKEEASEETVDVIDPEATFELAMPIVSDLHATTATLTWTSATDDDALKIKYRACVVTADKDISTYDKITASCSSGWVADWQEALTVAVTGLSVDTDYVAIVVAENQSDKN